MLSSAHPATPRPRPTHLRAPRPLQHLFRIAHRLAPGPTVRLAADVFGRPTRRDLTPHEAELVRGGRDRWLKVATHRLRAWEWGDPSLPTVVAHHGWGGRGAQLAAYGPPLAAAGFHFLCYDAPAHGGSSGRRTNLVDMTDILIEVVDRMGEVRAVVTHSMGGMVAARALKAGLPANALASIAPPGSMLPYLRIFALALGMGAELEEGVLGEIHRKLGLRPEDLDCKSMIPDREIPFLLVYDEDDRDVPPDHARRWATHWPRARVHRSRGLGHRGILRDARVQESVLNFLLEEIRDPGESVAREEGRQIDPA